MEKAVVEVKVLDAVRNEKTGRLYGFNTIPLVETFQIHRLQ